MDGRRLSVREQRILAEIETVLRRDRKLDERLRDLRLPLRLRLLSVQRRLRGAELSLLIPTTLLLALAAGRTGTHAVVIAACCVGAMTVFLLYGAVRGRLERRRRERWGMSRSRMTFPE